MRRREFLRVASGAAGATAVGASATAAAQETGTATPTPSEGTATGTPEGTGTATEAAGGGGGGGAQTVELVDFAYEPGTEEPLYVTPGTTVNFVWVTSTHNIVVDSQPEGANWQGHEPIENAGFEYSHTFETTGTYEFHCAPHLDLGMVGTIIVNEQGAPPSGGEGGGEVDPEHMGVPFQAHFVGLATLVGIAVSLVFTFFFLKYGETPHSGYPEEK
ncbi:MAG TPA: plastocyanin/azurin family copper-binding protein [Halobacteriales archaeon]|nr:plastocyanin/azurin family copper-binding protein [Halobacteriales archaeon]